MRKIDLYNDYLSDDEDKYVFLSVNETDEIEFELLVSEGFMYTLFLKPVRTTEGFSGITQIWQEDELQSAENGIMEITDLRGALEDMYNYETTDKYEEIQALYEGLIDILKFTINNHNRLFVSLEEV